MPDCSMYTNTCLFFPSPRRVNFVHPAHITLGTFTNQLHLAIVFVAATMRCFLIRSMGNSADPVRDTKGRRWKLFSSNMFLKHLGKAFSCQGCKLMKQTRRRTVEATTSDYRHWRCGKQGIWFRACFGHCEEAFGPVPLQLQAENLTAD